MIDQEQYTLQILSDFQMQNCNSVKTPCPTWRLLSTMCPKTDDEQREAAQLPFRALVGKCTVCTFRTALALTSLSLSANLQNTCQIMDQGTLRQANTCSVTLKEHVAGESSMEMSRILILFSKRSPTLTGPCLKTEN